MIDSFSLAHSIENLSTGASCVNPGETNAHTGLIEKLIAFCPKVYESLSRLEQEKVTKVKLHQLDQVVHLIS
jgi:hypothetical protein